MLSVEDVKKAIPNLDYGMAEIIADAHNHGLVTRFCCSGHLGYSPHHAMHEQMRGCSPKDIQHIINGYTVFHSSPLLIQVVEEAILANPKFSEIRVEPGTDHNGIAVLTTRGSSNPGDRYISEPYLLFLRLLVMKYKKRLSELNIVPKSEPLLVNQCLLLT